MCRFLVASAPLGRRPGAFAEGAAGERGTQRVSGQRLQLGGQRAGEKPWKNLLVLSRKWGNGMMINIVIIDVLIEFIDHSPIPC